MIRRALYFFLATILLYLSSAIAQEKKTSKQAVEKRLKAVDRKSTRLNSSHSQISYAVFCLKKKKELCTYTRTIIQQNLIHIYIFYGPCCYINIIHCQCNCIIEHCQNITQ